MVLAESTGPEVVSNDPVMVWGISEAGHASGAYDDQRIAEAFGVPFATVGRIVRVSKNARNDDVL
jgi:hypothetical protein